MKTHVTKINPEASVAEALDLIDLYQLSGLPIVDENEQLCGIITEGDICRRLFQPNPPENCTEMLTRSLIVASIRIADVMTHDVISVWERDTVEKALELFRRKNFKRIPVITEQGRVAGVLDRADLLQALFEKQL